MRLCSGQSRRAHSLGALPQKEEGCEENGFPVTYPLSKRLWVEGRPHKGHETPQGSALIWQGSV